MFFDLTVCPETAKISKLLNQRQQDEIQRQSCKELYGLYNKETLSFAAKKRSSLSKDRINAVINNGLT